MNDAEKLFWGAIGALTVALVVAAIRYMAKLLAERKADRVVVKGKLSVSLDAEAVQQIGCPGIVLSITCKSKRPAKIAGSHFSVALATEDLAAIERGFEMCLGQSENKALPPPRLQIQLFPLTERTNQNGFVLERDDVVRFFFPIAVPPLPLFLKARSEDVQVTATFFDGTTQVLAQGISVQDMLREILEAYKGTPMQLKAPMSMNVTVSADNLSAAGSMVGKLNPNEISFAPPEEPLIEEEFTEERMRNCMTVFREIINA